MHYPDFFDAVPRIRLHVTAGRVPRAFEGRRHRIRPTRRGAPRRPLLPHRRRRLLADPPGPARPLARRCQSRAACRGETFREPATAGRHRRDRQRGHLLTGVTTDTGWGPRRALRPAQSAGFRRPPAPRPALHPLDTGAAVDAVAHLREVPPTRMAPLMQACLKGQASADEARHFGELGGTGCARCCSSTATMAIFVVRPRLNARRTP